MMEGSLSGDSQACPHSRLQKAGGGQGTLPHAEVTGVGWGDKT